MVSLERKKARRITDSHSVVDKRGAQRSLIWRDEIKLHYKMMFVSLRRSFPGLRRFFCLFVMFLKGMISFILLLIILNHDVFVPLFFTGIRAAIVGWVLCGKNNMFATFPIASLRTYEALARTLNAKEAAKELGVTPSAVYHQVRLVEEWLGVPLFFRKHRGMQLSDAGRHLYSVLNSALLDIAVCVGELSPKPQAASVRIAVAPAFAEFWLVPRLESFHRSHPEVALHLDVTAETPDLSREAHIDVLICDRSNDAASLVRHAELPENIGVYGSAEQVARASYVPSSLVALPGQACAKNAAGWHAWIAAAGETWLDDGLIWREYTQPTLAIQAAIAGQGLILASTALVSDSVAQGRLMPYMSDVTLAGEGYMAVTLPGRERHPPARMFLDWLSNAFNTPLPRRAGTV